ncbi:uncharacterized protein LOC134178228 [Corticium candelabrum]|uniref:uncharacterized protein LOC134178228 n=1 Tax=Corticium candelabrum TaxID=121492 RepID=UPI002E264117|nr:uncharacterized protein LOC134178228 [Corticium candelabrum]
MSSRNYKRRLPSMPCIDQALSEAVIQNDMVEARRALQAGAFVNGLDREGLGAIHQAIYENNFDVLRLLVRHGADVRLRDSEGWTPLHTTAQTGNCEIARFLLKQGANTDAVDGDGLFPIDRAERSEMRSLLYKAMKRAGHVQLSDQYRIYLEQELNLEISMGDSDSLCSSISAYSLSMSEDEGQFSQSDGDELHGLATHVIAEESMDTHGVEISRECLPAGEESVSRGMDDKADASLASQRNTVGSDEIVSRLVRVTAFDNSPAVATSLVSVESRVLKDVHSVPDVNFVIVGECSAEMKVERCQTGLRSVSQESDEILHCGLSRNREIKLEEREDAVSGEANKAGNHVYYSCHLLDKETLSKLHSNLLADTKEHIQPSVNKQEVTNEQSDVRQFVSCPEVAFSRSQLKAARAAFFFSRQLGQRKQAGETMRHSMSPPVNRTVEEMNAEVKDSTQVIREELPGHNSLSSAFLGEITIGNDKGHSRLQCGDSPVGSNEIPLQGKDAMLGFKDTLDTNYYTESQLHGLRGLSVEADRHQVAVDAGSTDQEASYFEVVSKSDKTTGESLPQPPLLPSPESVPSSMSTFLEAQDVSVDSKDHVEEAMSSNLQTPNSENFCIGEKKLEAQRNITEIQEATIKECVSISEGLAVKSFVVKDDNIHCTVSSVPQTNIQSFGWESDSDDDCFCEETVVFFREDESGDFIRKESDTMSVSSLFSPDCDSPLVSLHSSTDPAELLSVSSGQSDDSECETRTEDQEVLLEGVSRRLQLLTSDDKMPGIVDSDQRQICVVKESDRNDVGHLSDNGDNSDDMMEEGVLVRTSPPQPHCLLLHKNTALNSTVNTAVAHHRSPPLKSIINRSSWPVLTLNKGSEHISQDRPHSLVGRSVSFEPLVCFQDAVVVGNVQEVKSLIKSQSVDLDAMTPQGYTVLHAAAIEGNIDCIEALISSGARVNIQDEDGWTPLHAAASHGHLDIIQYLLKSGANPCITGYSQETAYDVVDEDGDLIIEQILKNAMGDQFDVLVTNRCCEKFEDEYSEDGDDEESDNEEVLSPVDYGEDSNGRTLFHISRLTQAADTGKWLSHSSKVISPVTDKSPEPIHCEQCKGVSSCPLENAVSNEMSEQTISDTHQHGAEETSSLAVEDNADCNLEKTKEGICESSKPRGVLVLKFPSTFGVETPDVLSPKSVSFPPNVLLQQAVADGDIVEVDRLLTQYTTDELQINNVSLPSGVSVLHQSVNTENLAVTKVLIEKGSADPTIQDKDGWTPLHNAAAIGSCSIARYLISCGAKLSVLTAEGQFPSDVAEKPEMLSMLRNAMLGRFWGTSFKGSL